MKSAEFLQRNFCAYHTISISLYISNLLYNPTAFIMSQRVSLNRHVFLLSESDQMLKFPAVFISFINQYHPGNSS